MKKAVKLLSFILILSLAVFVFTACGASRTNEDSSGPSESTEESSSETESTSTTSSEDTIKITAIGLEDPAKMIENFNPLCEYLTQKIGKKVEFIPSANYEKAVEGLKDGTIDMASLGPVTYVQAHDGFGAEPIVKSLENGKASYESVIFVRKDSKISKVEDLKGKKVAFGDKDSMSSNCAPKYLMYNKGIKESDLAEAKNMTSQDDVITGVLNGDYDAGVAKSNVFDKNKDKGVGFKEIGRQGNIPTFPYTVRPGLDSKVKEDLKKALLELKDEKILKSIESKYTGFTEVSDEDYAWVRDAMNKLGIK